MKERELLTSLRRQVVNDELGIVSCRPRAKAAEYFDLAIGVVKPAPRDQRLLSHLIQMIGDDAGDRAYETWACLFDGLEDLMERRSLAARVQSVALEKCVRAATRADAGELKTGMLSLLGSPDVWDDDPPVVGDCLKKIVQPLAATLEFQPANQLNLAGISLCLGEVVALLKQQQNGTRAASLDLVAGLLAAEPDAGAGIAGTLSDTAFSTTSDPHWLRCRMAALLLEHIDRPDRCAQYISILFRDAIQAQVGDIETLTGILKRAAEFFGRLKTAGVYPDLCFFALHCVSQKLADRPLPAELDEALLEVHPNRDTVAPLVTIAWDRPQVGVRPRPTEQGDVPEWRDLFFFLLREPDEAKRFERMRSWLYLRLKFLFSHEPDRVLTFVEQVVKPLHEKAATAPPDYLAWLAGS